MKKRPNPVEGVLRHIPLSFEHERCAGTHCAKSRISTLVNVTSAMCELKSSLWYESKLFRLMPVRLVCGEDLRAPNTTTSTRYVLQFLHILILERIMRSARLVSVLDQWKQGPNADCQLSDRQHLFHRTSLTTAGDVYLLRNTVALVHHCHLIAVSDPNGTLCSISACAMMSL